MATENLTDSFLRSQRWAERMNRRPQIDVWDRRHGLVMRVTEGLDDRGRPKFTLTWCLVYRIRGTRRRLKLGRWPQLRHEKAREAADRAMARVAEGSDPVEDRRAEREHRREIENVVTVAAAAKRFLTEYRTRRREKWRQSTEYTNRRMIEAEVVPVLGNCPISLVSSVQIRDLLKGIITREGKGSRGNEIRANRVHALLSGLFKWAKRERLITFNPMGDVERLGAEQPRERRLSHAEIKKLWRVLGGGIVSEHAADQYRFMLATGQRVGECAKIEWQEIDRDTGWWTIPSEKSKNHHTHRVSLGPMAMEILTRRGPRSSGRVFELGDDIPSWIQEPLVKACAFVEGWQPRDLRRTVASETSPGFGRGTVAILLDHADPTAPKVTKVYDRGDQDPTKRRAMMWWDERLAAIVSSTAIELRPAANA